MNATNSQATDESVPVIEQALDFLLGETKRGDTVKQHLEKVCLIVTGRTEREQLFRAVMETLNEAGVRALDPASCIAEALTEKGQEQSAMESANGHTVH